MSRDFPIFPKHFLEHLRCLRRPALSGYRGTHIGRDLQSFNASNLGLGYLYLEGERTV